MLLKQNTARTIMILMIDSADHLTGKTGLTLTITASKDGDAFAAIAPTVADLGDGWYSLDLTTGHTDTLGDLALHITATGADPTDRSYQVLAELPGETTGLVSALLTAVLDDYEDVGEIRTVVAALSRLLNKIGPSGADLVTYMSDGTTPWFKQAVTPDDALDPISEIGGNVAP